MPGKSSLSVMAAGGKDVGTTRGTRDQSLTRPLRWVPLDGRSETWTLSRVLVIVYIIFGQHQTVLLSLGNIYTPHWVKKNILINLVKNAVDSFF